MSANIRLGTGSKISLGPTLFSGGREWQILLRGSSLRELLTQLQLKNVIVDIDPLETV